MLRRPLPAAAVVVLSLLVPASPAPASGQDVLEDCNDNGRLTKEYSQREYRQALANMPADLKQYTDCENIIRRAQLGVPDNSDAGANAGTPFAGATPEEIAQAQADIEEFRKSGGAPQRVGPGAPVVPGSLAFTRASAATSELPTPLLVLLVLLLLSALGAAAPSLDKLRRERRSGA